MGKRIITSDCGGKIREERGSKDALLILTDHCIICLRKVSKKRRRAGKHSKRGDDGSEPPEPEVAPKLVVSTSGFVSTFNQVWTVLQAKWKEKSNTTKDDDSSLKEIGISLESVLENGSRSTSTNVSFSSAPTICQLCCEKVVAVENLMKAVRQQVREINILLEEGRRRQDGGLGDLEKTLRENGVDDSGIRATLKLVGIFGSSGSKEDFQDGTKDDLGDAAEMEAIVKMEPIDSTDNNEDHGISGDDEVENADKDNLKWKPEEGDNNELADDKNESEADRVKDEEDTNDPDYKVRRRSPRVTAQVVSYKRKEKSKPRKRINIDGSSEVGLKRVKQVEVNDALVYPCSCGDNFSTPEQLLNHKKIITKEKTPHPKFFDYVNRHRQPCELCGKQIANSDILQHLTDHLNGQPEWVIRCPNDKCACMFVSPKGLQYHLHRDRSEVCKKMGKRKACDICGFTGKNIMKIRNHVRDKHENGVERKFKCPMSNCEKKFFVKQSVHFHLVEHRYRPPPITKQFCDKCGDSLESREMEEHLKDKHGVKEVVGCKQCTFKFSGRDEMVEHLFEHRDVGFLCDRCEDKQLKFSKYNDFREHYFVEHKLCPRRYKCGEGDCDKWFWRNYTKEEHEQRMHKEGTFRTQYIKLLGQKFECDRCSDKFKTEDNLTSHKIRIHGVAPFTCDVCGRCFDEKGKFNRHKKEHVGVEGGRKEWRCEVEGCGKVFGWRMSWKRHLEACHSTERKHVCEECGKGFWVSQGLKKHRDSVHLGLKRFVCEQCGERFYSCTTLKNHKLIHTGERPFACEICGQRFRQEGVLKRHLVAHEEKGAGFKPNGPMKQIRKRKVQDPDMNI